jgi:aspartate--ammonia ligase
MHAIRPDEKLSSIHSIYVDQWDWEKHIFSEQRNLLYLKNTVNRIYKCIKLTEKRLFEKYSEFIPELPDNITFIHSEELFKLYPNLTPIQREDEISRLNKAVFIIGIGNKLSNGQPHDNRAPDYDDWSSLNEDDYFGLNGDIIFWNPIINSSFEISSMGIRVNKESMIRQLEISNCQKRKNLLFHRLIINNELPLSIGGGIGQSRLCMFLMKKSHIGEVQSSIWPKEIIEQYKIL